MKKNKILTTILSFSLILQAFLFQIALPNMVLCFGGDGHIAIEWQKEINPCNHNSTAGNLIPSSPENKAAGHSTVECTDIKLHFHTSFAGKIQEKNHKAIGKTASLRAEVQILSSPTGHAFFYLKRFTHSISKIEALKTTVLLI